MRLPADVVMLPALRAAGPLPEPVRGGSGARPAQPRPDVAQGRPPLDAAVGVALAEPDPEDRYTIQWSPEPERCPGCGAWQTTRRLCSRCAYALRGRH